MRQRESFNQLLYRKIMKFPLQINACTRLTAAVSLLGLICNVSQTVSLSTPENMLPRRALIQRIPVLAGSLATVCVKPTIAASEVETIGKDPNCNDASCLGVWDGLLADCPHGAVVMNSGAGCASSQDDTPGVFAEPWDYSDSSTSLDYNEQMRMLVPAIKLVCSKRGDQVQFLKQEGRYLRVVFKDGKTGEVSSGEFYFTPNDTIVQFRLGALNPSSSIISSSTKNLERSEMIRKQMRYTKVPVLRNRKRALFFVESQFDTFGPGSASLGPPAEMSTGELEGRQNADPRMKIDALQQFPLGGTIGGRIQ